jgi:single-strand DNA-binding protein
MFIVQIAGRLGKDPETRFTPSGQKVTTFNVATNHRKGKEELTVWVRITVWGDRLDKIISYLKKGSAVVVIGRMNPPTSYVDKEGRTQISLDVTAEMIEFSPFGNPDRVQEGQPAQQGYQSPQGDYNGGSGSYEEPVLQGSSSSSAYGKSPYGGTTMTGQGNSHSSVDDDTLPF